MKNEDKTKEQLLEELRKMQMRINELERHCKTVKDKNTYEETVEGKDNLLHTISKLVKGGAWSFDPKTGKSVWTDGMFQIYDVEKGQDRRSDTGRCYYHGVNGQKLDHAVNGALEHGIPYDLELEIISAKSLHKWVRIICDPVIKNGRTVLLQGSLQDITEQKQIEESLRLTKFIFDKAPIGIWRMEENGKVLDVNEQGCSSLGYTRDELCNMMVFDFAPGFCNEDWINGIAMLDKTGSRTVEVQHQRKSGEIFPIQVIEQLMRFEEQKFHVSFVQDISQRKQNEEELRKTKDYAEQEQNKWLTVLEHVSNAIEVYDTSGNRIYANTAATQIYTLPRDKGNWEFITKKFAIQSYPGKRNLKIDEWPVPRVLRGEHLEGETFYIKRLDEKRDRILKFYASPIYNAQGEVILAVLVTNDITEQLEREKQDKLMQERMEQTQRLESLGVLAGGIAHDFNNLLMAVLGHADIALLKLSQPSPMAEDLENIKTASLRASDLCTQLLAYSGQGKIEEKEFSISALVSEMAQMLKTSISKTCVLNLNLEEQLPLIIGDPSQVRQIVMNFVINASEAIAKGNGIIKITTKSMNYALDFFTDDYVVKPIRPGHYVILEVSDNGPGMDKEAFGRIFEPFFTTKFTGRGLGLSAVLGIVRSHGGGLKVSSEPGTGTSFRVLFPAIDRPPKNTLVNIGTNTKNAHFVGKVLLIDDEEIVRSVCSSQLEMLGFEVLTARDGQEGVEIYQEQLAGINLVILDLTMPKMGGEETFHNLRQLNPGVKIILASGYAVEDVTTRFGEIKPAGYLRKPYTIKELTGVLSEGLKDY